MNKNYAPTRQDSESTEESEETSASMEMGLLRKVGKSFMGEDREAPSVVQFRRMLGLAISLAFWIVVFGLPMINLQVQWLLFGQRNAVTVPSMVEEWHSDKLNATSRAREIISPTEQALAQARSEVRCAATDSGRMTIIEARHTNLSSGVLATGPPQPFLVDYNPALMGHDWHSRNPQDVWCGYFPGTYLAFWPNVAQLIVYTVYKNTGSTIALAWQGVIGTLLAGLNVEFMTFLFPLGARAMPCIGGLEYTVMWYHKVYGWRAQEAHTMTEAANDYIKALTPGLKGIALFFPNGTIDATYHKFESTTEEKKMVEKYQEERAAECQPGTLHYEDPNYAKYGWICWVDVFGFMLVMLMSKASRNNLMFCLSWHVYYLMDFMNPSVGVTQAPRPEQWGGKFIANWLISTHFVVSMTTLIGAYFAIQSTLMPFLKVTSLHSLYEESSDLTQDIAEIWENCVTYLGGTQKNARRLQISKKIDNVAAKGTDLDSNFATAWWEAADDSIAG